MLGRQVFADFEVIVVDQSAVLLDLNTIPCNFVLHYIHTTERGPGKARNLGIKHARGQVIAFTDDDCEPDAYWLANAYKYFNDDSVVGIEGLIVSDRDDEERFRIVTNQRFRNIGFMTANLFLRKEVIDEAGGFDERFERPFREDTDLAWRALAHGQIPFASDVKVLHPAHPRDAERESSGERAKFFIYDPLLFSKHPARYVQLLRGEGHHTQTPGFWEHFMRGMVKHRLDIPIENLRGLTTDAQYALLGELAKLLGSERMEPLRRDEASTAVTNAACILPETPAQSARAKLTHHLQVLLDSYNNLEYGRQLNPVDAFFAFRFLLGRNPDLAAELPHILTDRRSTREFLNALLNSDEFSHCLGFVPPNRVLMAELEGFRLWFNTSDREMGMAMVSGQYEPRSIEVIKKIVQPGMKCIDAGAHIGFYTCLMASLVGESGKIYAFEPMPSNFELMLKNIEENRFQRIVREYQHACSDTVGTVTVSKISNMFVVGQVDGAERVAAEAVRLDDVIEDAIDLVKLDVEGHEPAVIRGMMSLIARDHPIILSEINEYWLQSCSHSSAIEYVGLLESLGYEVFDVNNLTQPLNEPSHTRDILETVDVVAFPRTHQRQSIID